MLLWNPDGKKMVNINVDRARSALQRAGIEIVETRELSFGRGYRLRCAGGQVVVIDNTGKAVVRVANAVAGQPLFAPAPATATALRDRVH